MFSKYFYLKDLQEHYSCVYYHWHNIRNKVQTGLIVSIIYSKPGKSILVLNLSIYSYVLNLWMKICKHHIHLQRYQFIHHPDLVHVTHIMSSMHYEVRKASLIVIDSLRRFQVQIILIHKCFVYMIARFIC